MLVLAALFEGQQVGTRRRLKTCRNPRCRVAFYDRSRNASGVWHSVRICGNAINLRAHRERRRGQRK
jgi:predicted RNA-binding Zn ribbon-like protein